MTHKGRYDNIKALLNVSPPRAVRLDLPLDDNVEQSALRSTCSGSLASAIDLLESKINPLESKIKAGRLLPAAAFAGGDSDLSKLKALQQVAVMIKTLGSINYQHACSMLLYERRQFYHGLNAASVSSQKRKAPNWSEQRAGNEMVARLPLIRVPLHVFGHGGNDQSLVRACAPDPCDATFFRLRDVM